MRHQLGFFPALLETWKRATFQPTAFFSTLAPGRVVDAWAYSVLLAIPSGILSVLFSGTTSSSTWHQAGISPLSAAIGAAIFSAVWVWIAAIVLHVCAIITGASSQGFDATFRAVAYSFGPMVIAWVPIVGSFAGIWILVLVVIALRYLQRTSVARAILAIALPTLLSCVCMAAVVASSTALLMRFTA